KEFQDASSYPLITAKLLERGFSRPEVRGILGENFLRFLNRF
ncbi:MAG: membrane dipeptidase, partial [Deltaproteobacteria bacterium]|nr:membrane dipeptidase [Deltaproteobacteria bacterium]